MLFLWTSFRSIKLCNHLEIKTKFKKIDLLFFCIAVSNCVCMCVCVFFSRPKDSKKTKYIIHWNIKVLSRKWIISSHTVFWDWWLLSSFNKVKLQCTVVSHWLKSHYLFSKEVHNLQYLLGLSVGKDIT